MNQFFETIQELYFSLVHHLAEEIDHMRSLEGLWLELIEYVILYPAAMALIWIVFGFFYVLKSEWRIPYHEDFNPSVAVVVPAHNEESVIAQSIEHLLAQNYQNMQIHVVSDGSTDATTSIARRYVDRGVCVHDLQPNHGKSEALQYLVDKIDTDLFMVVDADTQAAPDAITYMVQQFIDPKIAAVTGHTRVKNRVNLLTAIQAMEYAVIVSLAKRAEQFWGGLYTISGAAACIRTQALRAVGGWSARTATEDIEISWRLQKAGWRLAYEPRALFHVLAPVRLGALYRQRQRWAQGMTEVLRLHWNLAQTRNAALIPIMVQVFATAVWVILMTLLLLLALVSLLSLTFDYDAIEQLMHSEWYIVFYWTYSLFALQAFTACMFDGNYTRGVWKSFPLFVTYPFYYWLVIYPCFLLGACRGLAGGPAGKWNHTERTVT